MISKTTPKTAIILAGGLGTRLEKLNPDRPKPMALVNNIPFLEYLLMYLVNLGIEIFILQVSYKYKIIQNHFGNEFRGSKLIYEIEDIPMGTGGGLIITQNVGIREQSIAPERTDASRSRKVFKARKHAPPFGR